MSVIVDDRLNEIDMKTPQVAIAKGIEALTNPSGCQGQILSNIKESHLEALTLKMTISKALNYNWLEIDCGNELNLRNSLPRKGKRARDDVVEVCRPKEDKVQGALASFKESISSFWKA